MFATRLDDLPDNGLQLIVTGYYGPGKTAYGMNWADSLWVTSWAGPHDTYIMWPTSSPRDKRLLVWKTTVPTVSRLSHIVAAVAYRDSISVSDTVAVCDVEAFMYTGCMWGNTRWVAVRDLDNATLGFPYRLRIYRSDSVGPWTKVRDELLGRFPIRGVAIQPLDSLTLLVVTADSDAYLRYGLLRDTTWTPASQPLSGFGIVNSPQFRETSKGGSWLAWADADSTVLFDRYADGEWVEPDTIHSIRPDRNYWQFYQPYVSKDTGTYPAVAWHGFSSPGLIDHVWVSFPTDSGFGIGERLEGTAFGYLPQVARDEHGDVWVAFSRDLAGAFWLHTYVHATTSDPEVIEQAGRPLVRWSLSEPAPETWWAIERATGAGEFEVAGRVRATSALAMQWRDTTGPTDQPLRYRVRRESKDVRYRWWSAEAAWQVRGPALRLSRSGANPATDSIDLEVSGATAGTVTLRLHDLQGRLVLTRTVQATGTARDDVSMPLAGTSLKSGIYLLSVQGADGRASAGLKVAVLR